MNPFGPVMASEIEGGAHELYAAMRDAITLAVRNLGDESVRAQELNASGDVLGASALLGATGGLGSVQMASQGAIRESLDGMLAAQGGRKEFGVVGTQRVPSPDRSGTAGGLSGG